MGVNFGLPHLPRWAQTDTHSANTGLCSHLQSLTRRRILPFLVLLLIVLFLTLRKAFPTVVPGLLPLSNPTWGNISETGIPPEYIPLLRGRQELPDSFHTYETINLGKRLISFLRRPVLTFEEAVDDNEKACPVHQAEHLDFFSIGQKSDRDWKDLPTFSILQMRADIITYLDNVARNGWELVGRQGSKIVWRGNQPTSAAAITRFGHGRGIVSTAGNRDSVKRLITRLRLSKKYGISMPTEIFHFHHELRNASEREEIEALGGTLREINLEGLNFPSVGWMIKPLAIIQSSFREVLFLDPDSVPLRDPSHLFDSGKYKAYGSVFWADLWKFHPHSALWRILGRTCSFEDWGFESGQILIDKTGQDGLNLAALWVSVAMLDNDRMWSKYLYGDKDAFRFAFEILGLNFGRARTIPSLAGFIGQKSGQFCGSAQVQYDLTKPKGSALYPPLFLHYNMLKLQAVSPDFEWFTHLSRMTKDEWSEASLNDGHGRIMWDHENLSCLNAVWHPEETPPAGQSVEVISFEDIKGQPLVGFQADFRAAGGYAVYPVR